MTSWRKDTPITATRDILLQGAQLSCQTAAPCPSGSPGGAASRGCGGEGEAVAVHPAPGFSRPPRWLQPPSHRDSNRALSRASCVQGFGLFIATL